jgi:hypothetical protein
MHLTYVPLLEEERALYALPRDYKRFKAYLHMNFDAAKGETRYPLLGMNPMAKGHVADFLDALLAVNADTAAQRAMEEAAPHLADVPGTGRVCLSVADDVAGGWTNRYSLEYAARLSAPTTVRRPWFEGWLPVTLWVSEPPTAAMVREEVLTALIRVGHVHRHGHARTLGELMAQEGRVMLAAGCTTPALDAEEIEYTRWVLGPYLGSSDMRTGVECLFGDAAARTLGFSPMGLSHRAGLALALHDARLAMMNT